MSKSRGVLYMISGTKHLNVLVVSIFSLRKSGYAGNIHIAVGDDDSEKVVRMLSADQTIFSLNKNLDWSRWCPPTGNRGDGYRQKTFMGNLSPFDSTVFLDADTVVRGPIDPLFTPEPLGVTLTAFSDWKSNGRKIPGRIKGWTDVAPDDVAEMLSKPYPAINTGVLSWRNSPESDEFFREWQQLCAKKGGFICDEIAAQLIFYRHGVRVLASIWNHSPIHSREKNWKILHAHGKKHVSRKENRDIWLPIYDECCRLNIAGINSWTPAGDKRLREYLEGRDGAGTPDDEETLANPDESEEIEC